MTMMMILIGRRRRRRLVVKVVLVLKCSYRGCVLVTHYHLPIPKDAYAESVA
jgi:hypothetical protein